VRKGQAALAWIAAAWLLSSCAPTTTDIVRVGIAAEPYPPFTSRSKGEWVGFEIDLYRAVCEAEGLRCEPVEVPWDDIIPALMDRRIGAASDPARPSLQDRGSLTGKIIGVQEATISADFATEKFGNEAKIRMYATLDGALSALKNGKIDYVSDGAYAVAPFLSHNPSFAVKAIWPVDPIFGRGVGAGVREEDGALRQKLNRGIAAVVKGGRYDDILRAYPGLSDEVRRPQF
jgi:polar amino acid transport system substrate-binding protein